MKISTKGRYALRMALDVAQHQDAGPVSLREVSQRQGISLKYLEQLARSLSKGGVLASTRGARGGYSLARDANDISAGDVLRCSEGGTAPVACLEEGYGICPMRSECETIAFWEGLDRVIEQYVDGVSLAQMAQGKQQHVSNRAES